jgi:hypothetical protein
MYSIPFIGILFIIISLSLSNTRKKRRHSNDISPSYITISMHPFSNDQYIPNVISIPLQDDDEDLIQSDISSNFCDNDSIELRLDADDENDN